MILNTHIILRTPSLGQNSDPIFPFLHLQRLNCLRDTLSNGAKKINN